MGGQNCNRSTMPSSTNIQSDKSAISKAFVSRPRESAVAFIQAGSQRNIFGPRQNCESMNKHSRKNALKSENVDFKVAFMEKVQISARSNWIPEQL